MLWTVLSVTINRQRQRRLWTNPRLAVGSLNLPNVEVLVCVLLNWSCVAPLGLRVNCFCWFVLRRVWLEGGFTTATIGVERTL